jgi:photosystem II stability/assembly factor-like uncharacterized protein
VYAASEAGGVFVSRNGGASWHHVDAIAMAMANDVKYMPGRPNVIVATGDYDGRVDSLGGIWISRDDGAAWNPVSVGTGCTLFPSARRITFGRAAGRPMTIYVADDCGVAVSSDLGVTWRHLEPEGQAIRYYDIGPRGGAFGDDFEVIADHTGPPSTVLYTTNSFDGDLLWGSKDELRTSRYPFVQPPPDVCGPGGYFQVCEPRTPRSGAAPMPSSAPPGHPRSRPPI